MHRTWTDPLVRPKPWKRNMRVGKWNVRSLYRSGSLTTAVRELARYKLDSTGEQEVRWDKGARQVRLIKMCLNETYCRVRISKHLSSMFHVKNGLKQGGVLLPLLLTFTLKYPIRRVQENQDGLKLNGIHHLLVYADDVIYWAETCIQ